ncbi:MAG: hybrid sensor histidine kinase/response regulator [Microvirgula sp.]
MIKCPWPRFDEPRLLAAQMALIDQSFGMAMLGCSMAALLLAMSIVLSGGSHAVGGWAAAMAVACGIGHFGRRLFPARTGEEQACGYATALTLLLTVLGGLWGLAGWLYLDLRFPPSAVCLLSLIAGMSSAALSIFSPCLPLAVGFLLPAILPVWAVFLVADNPHYLPLQLGVPLFLLALLVFAYNYWRGARRSIQLRFENIELVAQLHRQTELAEEANRAKSVFLASASHDLRQPLHALGLFVVSLGRTALSGKQRELLDHIEASSAAAREMLNTLLDFSKLEAGVIEARPRPFRLQPMLRKLENEFAPQADGKALIYRTRDTTGVANADPGLVELILRNLIANAIRYTSEGGLLVGCRRRGGELAIEVWDTGAGIPASQHREIFREFHQLGNPERDRRKGLGLGLAIVDGLARTMQVRVELASVPARGSVFRLCLPQAGAEQAVAETVPAASGLPTLQGRRILVVDDDPAVRTAMTGLLAGWHSQCLAVESVQEAVDCLDGFTPELVIADYRLRGQQTGQQALEAIFARLGQSLPAVILTGDTAPDRLRDARASGAFLLHKPVDTDVLLQTLARLLERRQGLRPGLLEGSPAHFWYLPAAKDENPA